MEENREIQRKKLYKFIQYANQNIPYYQRIIKEYDIKFAEESIFDDIKKFLLLNKDVIGIILINSINLKIKLITATLRVVLLEIRSSSIRIKNIWIGQMQPNAGLTNG